MFFLKNLKRTRRIPAVPRQYHLIFTLGILLTASASFAEDRITLNTKDDGYRGIWYMNQPLKSVYKYKYSGGLGTYCAKHKPFAVYCDTVNKTFFCYGGTSKANNRSLIHMVSYYDHEKKGRPSSHYSSG